MLEQSGDWAWGYGEHDRYVGYVRADALADLTEATHVVTARSALLFSEPSSRAALVAALPMGSLLSGSEEGEYLRTDQGHVALRQLASVSEKETDPAAAAERMLDTPYLWGGRGLGGIDCSGLVQVAFGLADVPLPRDSDQQIREGVEVAGELRRSDLLFYPDHVVLMTGPDRAIHASGYWMSTVAEPLSDIVARLGEPVARRRVLS